MAIFDDFYGYDAEVKKSEGVFGKGREKPQKTVIFA